VSHGPTSMSFHVPSSNKTMRLDIRSSHYIGEALLFWRYP
jgi:hypothetical protein